ncbi:MAG: DUF1080 domain-containing protein [Acidobacteria bacterium]|nr:DUF1080 domain-containing protein [Acidobacteriota bacterium]
MVRRAMAAGLVLCAGLFAQAPAAEGGWRPLFDGKSLAGWKESDFFGAGKVRLQSGQILIGAGVLTGITWAGAAPPMPRTNYEIRVEAERVSGGDFFAGITFPVGNSYCTWINGGWGGRVVGLSSIDGADAAGNDTTLDWQFQTGRWYTLRLRVTPERITAWIDRERVIDAAIAGKWIALREGDIDRSIPFGIATYATVGAVRKIEWRPVPPADAR